MKVYIKSILKWSSLIVLVAVIGCNDFLDIKPNKSHVVPSSLKDLQALLDNTNVMNRGVPIMGEISADNYYVSPEQWGTVSLIEQRNAYIWEKDIYIASTQTPNDWFAPYQMVTHANLALEGISKLDPLVEKKRRDNIKGSALFYRSWAFYHLSQLFCKDYDPVSATKDLGIPLRLESGAEGNVYRNTVEEVYSKILTDLHEAVSLLPDLPIVKTRPSKAAVFALLAKIYLQMENYQATASYADSCLVIQSEIIDFNQLDSTKSFPIALFNKEVIFHSNTLAAPILNNTRLNIDTILYGSYHKDDLRKQMFFWDNNGVNTFKGSYTGSSSFFGGLSTNEMYLTRAEANVRLKKVQSGVNDLNKLLINRYHINKYTTFSSSDENVVLTLILKERRKELLFRGIRWSDLRRLNKDSRFAKVLMRKLDGKVYELLPNSAKYILPIPDMIIEINGLPQNERVD